METFNPNAELLVTDDFLTENRIKGYYYVYNVDENGNRTHDSINDETSPETRTIVLTDETTYRKVFKDTAPEVNFDEEMVIVYVLLGVEYREHELNKITFDNGTLEIYIKWQTSDVPDANIPYQRCFMVKLKKVDFESVEFIRL